jgi:transcriptional regulator with XRE-family HTH domain
MGALATVKFPEVTEMEKLGLYIKAARIQGGLSQSDLGARSGLSQTQISYFEAGARLPSFDQLLRVAAALDVSIQKLIAGSDRPGTDLRDIVIELRQLGIVDLWVRDAQVPGAFRRPEELIALVVAPEEADPRIVEAVPAILAWNEFDPTLLQAFGLTSGPRTCRRLAWLADVTLAIEKQGGFPGGCRRESLARFTRLVPLADANQDDWDSFGRSSTKPSSSPLWKRWRIRYDSSLDEFKERAKLLDQLRKQPPSGRSSTGRQPKLRGPHRP